MKAQTTRGIEQMSDQFHKTIQSERRIAFGEFMTLIETLNLPEKQYLAVKQLIARQIDRTVFSLADCFDNLAKYNLDYEKTTAESVPELA